MKILRILIAVLIFVGILLLLAGLFIVREGQSALVLRLGRLVMNEDRQMAKILNPGLHIKIPLIENTRIFDTRIQTLDIKSSRIVTREKKDVIVDYYVKWQIRDLAKYFTSTSGNAFKAQTLLEQQLNTSLRAEFGKRTIPDLVSGGRDDIMEVLRTKAEQQAQQLGIRVVDVRIKGIELPENTSNAIYQRMRADMQKIANAHRADGNAAAEEIQAVADAQVTVLLAKARNEAQLIRANAQAEAALTYATAFSKDESFFDFYRSLMAYKMSFANKQDVFVLAPNTAFFDYFKKPLVQKGSPVVANPSLTPSLKKAAAHQ